MCKLFFLVGLLACSTVLYAQSFIEVGGTVDTSRTPNKSVYGSYLRALPGGFRSFTTMSFWQVAPNQVAHSEVTGVERSIFSQGWFTLAGHVQGGVAQAANAFSGSFSGGGAVILEPGWLKRKECGFVTTGGASDVPATGAWYPKVSFGFRCKVGP